MTEYLTLLKFYIFYLEFILSKQNYQKKNQINKNNALWTQIVESG